ncbi:hypothetical protein [Clostridium sp.]|uniref:hypothetical protein n=1 Tax=Clostridium sp. TaxID=1506 RepID=UPI002621AFCF|nr:hypothetical protein [Clostridium sp.]
MIYGISIKPVNADNLNLMFCIDEVLGSFGNKYKVSESELKKLELWLESESTSIGIKCENGRIIFLNKHNIQYAITY